MRDIYDRDITQSGNQYTADGITIEADSPEAALNAFDGMAPAGQAAIQPAQWSPREFMRRFTPEELVGIHVAARTDAMVAILLSNALADVVSSDSEELQQGLAYLVSAGLLAQDRADQIKDPTL